MFAGSAAVVAAQHRVQTEGPAQRIKHQNVVPLARTVNNDTEMYIHSWRREKDSSCDWSVFKAHVRRKNCVESKGTSAAMVPANRCTTPQSLSRL